MDELNDYYSALKKRIVDHCAIMAKYDRAYAVFAWKQYCDALPWLGLDLIKKTQTDENSVK